MTELSTNGKALIVTICFRLLYGGYLAGMDHYLYNDPDVALSVIVLYGLFGVFAALYLAGKRHGLTGILALTVILLVTSVAYDIIALTELIDVGAHDPRNNLIITALMYLFSLLTLLFAIKTYREPPHPTGSLKKAVGS